MNVRYDRETSPFRARICGALALALALPPLPVLRSALATPTPPPSRARLIEVISAPPTTAVQGPMQIMGTGGIDLLLDGNPFPTFEIGDPPGGLLAQNQPPNAGDLLLGGTDHLGGDPFSPAPGTTGNRPATTGTTGGSNTTNATPSTTNTTPNTDPTTRVVNAPPGYAFPSVAARRYNAAFNQRLETEARQMTSSFSYWFKNGARVTHGGYGPGTVVSTDSDGTAIVQFDGGQRTGFGLGRTLSPAAGETRFDFVDPNGSPFSLDVVKGLILIRDIFVAQMRAYGQELARINGQTYSQLGTMYDQLVEQAKPIERAYNIMEAKREAAEAYDRRYRTTDRNRYMVRMREVAELEKAGRHTEAQQLRDSLKDWNKWGQYLELRNEYYSLLQQNPLLGLSIDGTFLWQALDPFNDREGAYIAENYAAFGGRAAQVQMLRDFLKTNSDRALALATESENYTDLKHLWKFGTDQYRAQQQAGAMMGQAFGAEFPALIVDATRGVVAGSEAISAYETAGTDFVLGILAAGSLLIPLFGPFISFGLGGAQLFRDGNQLVVVYGDLETAQQLGNVSGYQHIGSVEDRVDAQETKVVLSAAATVLDFADVAVTGVRVLRTRGGGEAAGTGRAIDESLPDWMKLEGDALIVPAGARAATTQLDDAASAAVLGRLDNAQLTSRGRYAQADAALYATDDLRPRHTIEVGGRRFHVSRPFVGPEGKTSVIAYEETAAGTVMPRTFYMSGEHGLWRAAVSQGSLLNKGPIKYVDGQGNEITAEAAMAGGARAEFVNEAAVDLAGELQGPLSRWTSQNEVANLGANTDRAFYGGVEQAGIYGHADSEFGGIINRADVSVPLPVASRTPDLQRGPLDMWEVDHHLYGRVQGFLYRSTDGDALMVVMRDSRGNVWVPSIQNGDALVTPFGTRTSAFDQSGLAGTPIVKTDTVRGATDAPDLGGGYTWTTGYRNPLNQQIGGALPPPNQVGNFNPTASLDDIQPPRPATTTTPTPTSTPRVTPRGLGAATRAGLHAESGSRTAEETERLIREVESGLRVRRLPRDPAELRRMLDGIDEQFREGKEWQEADRLQKRLEELYRIRGESRDAEVGAIIDGGGTLLVTPDQQAKAGEWAGGTAGITTFDPAVLNSALVKAEELTEGETPEFTRDELRYIRGALRRGDVGSQPRVLDTTGRGDETRYKGTRPLVDESQLDLLKRAFPADRPLQIVPGQEPEGFGPPVLQPSSLDGTAGVFRLDGSNPLALGGPAGTGSSPVQAAVVASGGSTGDVMQLHLVNTGSDPINFSTDSLVFEPVTNPSASTQAQVRAIRNAASGTGLPEGLGMPPGVGWSVASVRRSAQGGHAVTVTLESYCLAREMTVPTEGTLFRVAPEAVQEDHRYLPTIYAASETLARAGALQPQGDPAAYLQSLRQWAIWTLESGFDEAGFSAAFLEHSRGNVADAGMEWSEDIENMLAELIPTRWQDVERVLAEGGF